MHIKKFKLLYSFFGVIFTAVTLTSTTFAWFANNKEAWIDEFEVELKNTDNLLISVDGINYRSSIPNDLLKRAIAAKKLNLELNDETLTDTLVNETFNKIGLDAVTTDDLVNFKNIDKSINAIDENIEYYPLTKADDYSYITFDLWFKVLSTNTGTSKYNLKFVSDTYATSNNTKVSYVESDPTIAFLYNELTTTGSEDTRTGVRESGINKGVAYEKGKYLSGDSITSNPSDAVRIGVIHSDASTKTVYEPSIGLGSYAIDKYSKTEVEGMDIYDPTKNAMLTYFNNTNEAKIEAIKDNEDFYMNTQKDFNGDVSFAEFENTGSGYEAVKLTVAIWIEAYDADYIVGLQNGSVKIMLNFCVEEE